jgi:hypothetical protein
MVEEFDASLLANVPPALLIIGGLLLLGAFLEWGCVGCRSGSRPPVLRYPSRWASPRPGRRRLPARRAVDYEDLGHVVNLTNRPGADDWPAWSPDGKQLACASNPLPGSDGEPSPLINQPYGIYRYDVRTPVMRPSEVGWLACHDPAWQPNP